MAMLVVVALVVAVMLLRVIQFVWDRLVKISHLISQAGNRLQDSCRDPATTAGG